MRYHITPVAKPRMTQADKWLKRKCVLVYRAFADEVRLRMRGVDLNVVQVVFGMAMPRSWPLWVREERLGQPHRQKPDLDNLLKALTDALYPDSDAAIHTVVARKIWSIEPYIEVQPADLVDRALHRGPAR